MTPILFLDTNHGFGGDTVALLNMLEILEDEKIPAAVACVAGSPVESKARRFRGIEIIPLKLSMRAGTSRLVFIRQIVMAAVLLMIYCLRHRVRVVHLSTIVAGTSQALGIFLRVASLGWLRLVYHAHCSPKFDLLSRLTLRASSRVWAVSEYTAQQHRDAGVEPGRIRLMPNLVREPAGNRRPSDSWRGRLGIPADARLIAVVARLSPNKGQHIAISAISQLRDPHHLVLAGDDRVPDGNLGFRDQLVRMTSEAGLGERVHFVGHIDDPVSLFREADLVLVPSDDESFCLSAAEAIVAGARVIASNSSALREVVGTTAGLPVVDRTPEAFAEAIQQGLADGNPADREEPGRRLLAAYGSESFRKNVLRHLSDALGQLAGDPAFEKEDCHA